MASYKKFIDEQLRKQHPVGSQLSDPTTQRLTGALVTLDMPLRVSAYVVLTREAFTSEADLVRDPMYISTQGQQATTQYLRREVQETIITLLVERTLRTLILTSPTAMLGVVMGMAMGALDEVRDQLISLSTEVIVRTAMEAALDGVGPFSLSHEHNKTHLTMGPVKLNGTLIEDALESGFLVIADEELLPPFVGSCRKCGGPIHIAGLSRAVVARSGDAKQSAALQRLRTLECSNCMKVNNG